MTATEPISSTIPANLTEANRARFAASGVTSLEQLHEINGAPHPQIVDKHTDYLTPLLVEFIELVPYYLLSSSNSNGTCDVSPRGDAPGAVKVLDARTIALPDRPGNRRIDTLSNIVTNPHVGLLMLIPAVDETVRINGRASITTDPELLATMQMQGKTPKMAIVVDIDEVYVHCARSILRAGLWSPDKWPDPDDVPTLAAIMSEQKNFPKPDEGPGRKRNEEYRQTLY
ncbi:pyridoxamine 5'-phosphate oxidase family protein [soil metagenome]